MELGIHLVLICAVLLGVRLAQSEDASDKLCDSQLWYLDLITEGPLSGSAESDHQQAVHAKIKALMAKLKSQGQGYKVACSRLQAFEEVLNEQKDHGGASGSPKESSEEKSAHRNEEEKVPVEGPNETMNASDSNGTKTEENESEDSVESVPFEYDFLMKDRQNDESGERSKQKEVSAKVEDNEPTDDKASGKPNDIDSGDSASKTEEADPTEVDETELPEDAAEQEDSTTEESSAGGDGAVPATATISDNVVNTTLENSTHTESWNKSNPGSRVHYKWILQGACLKNQSHAIDIFCLKRRQPMPVKIRNVWRKKCANKLRSTFLCLYLQTLLFVSDILDTPVEKNLTEVSDLAAVDLQRACNMPNACSPMCFYAFENLRCLEAYETQRENKPAEAIFSSNETSEQGTEENSKVKESSPETGTGIVERDDLKESKQEENFEKTESSREEEKSDDTGEEKQDGDTARETIGESIQGKDFAERHFSSEDIREALGRERAELEQVFHAQASEYAGKIQSLELMVTKLENQVLLERLTKQNDSAVVSRLETQILRLENQLLKLSQSHAQLHEEHERTKRTQRPDVLGLDHVTRTSPSSSSGGLAAYNASLQREQQQLLSLQQARLLELKDVLKNHTAQMDRLQSKTALLEEQNQLLFQTVLNQSALIASILGQLQQLGEDNARQRQETSSLQSQMALQRSSDRLFAKIETLVASAVQSRDESTHPSDSGASGNEGGGPDEDSAEQERSSRGGRGLADFLPRVPGAGFPAWHCGGNNSTRVCFAYSILLTPCPPFSPVYWSPCPFYVGDLSDDRSKKQPESKEVGPQQVAAKPEEQDKERGGVDEELKDEAADEHQSKKADDESEDNSSKETESHSKSVDDKSSSDEPLSKSSSTTDDGEERDDEKQENEDRDNEKEDIQKEEKEDTKEIDKEKDGAKGDEKREEDATQGDTEKQSDKKEGNENERDISASKKKEDSAAEQTDSSQTNGDDKGDNKRSEKDNSDEDKQSPTDTASGNEDAKLGGNKKVGKDNKTDNEADKDSKAASSTSEDKAAGDDKKGDQKSTSPTEDKQSSSPTKNKKDKASTEPEDPKERQVLYTSSSHKDPKDCWDHYQRGKRHNGLYKIRLATGHKLEVFCDMRGGGWTVVLRRQDGSVNFYRSWQDYKKGFGDVLGEYYLGNDHLHHLTNQGRYTLAVDLWDWSFQRQRALYGDFWVDDEDAAFRLHVYGHSGQAPDALLKHNLMKFSTHDRDNDLVAKGFPDFNNSCARRFRGAGWYYKCYASNVFGKYYPGGDIPEKKFDGITWKPWTGPNYSLKEVIFKVRPADAED